MSNILKEIVENKRKEIEVSKEKLSIDEIKKPLERSDRSFYNLLKGKNNIIAEIKFKSPSAGEIREKNNFDEIVECYDEYASSISVLTDEKYFGGSLDYINKAKKLTKLPILRKDFIIDEYQVYESRYYGADAILLIASLLSKEEIDSLLEIARDLGMECLIEVSNKEELEKVLETKARIIGINNRDLKSFDIDINKTSELKKLISEDKIVVAESGFCSKKDILEAGTNAALIGTYLMKSDNIKEALSSLHRCKVKICGITNIEDAKNAVDAGADILGFNFYKESPRYIDPEKAKEIIETLSNNIQTAGVFVNSPIEEVNEITKTTEIDFIQLHGNEDEEFCGKVNGNVIKACKVKGKELIGYNKNVYAALFDSFDEELYGGTGKQFDLSYFKEKKAAGKTFIAGGVNVENVGEILKAAYPYCVDVCSGVEESKGKKDKGKMKELIKKVRLYEA